MNTRILVFSLLAAVFATQSPAAEVDSAQTLHDQHCMSCHGTEVYTREARMVGSLQALENQVRRCETTLGLRWFDEEVSGVTQLLNDRFYHFEP